MSHSKSNQIKFLVLLGIPALGTALTYTLVTTYIPFFLEKLSSASVTGVLISIEGFFAITVPILIGLWSDAITSPLGKRLPFFFIGVLISSIILLMMPFSSNSLTLLTLELIFFFMSYFVVYEAYYSLYPDLVSNEKRGRSQGIMGGFKAIGMFMALTGGGFLLTVWKPFPFIAFTAIMIAVSVVLYYTVKNKITQSSTTSKGLDWRGAWKLIKGSKKIQLWLVANTFWEASVAVLRVFIIIYFTKGLHLTLDESSEALAMVGVAAIFAAPLSGFLADKYGHKPVVLTAVFLFGVGLVPPLFTVQKIYLVGILPVAFTAVVLMTLPFSMLMYYLPKNQRHGTGSALFLFCQGLGVLIGPIIGGFVIDTFRNFDVLVFQKTQGYSSMFIVASGFLFLSLPFTFNLFKLVENESESSRN